MRYIIALLIIVNSSALGRGLHFSDLVKQPGYKENWARIIRGQKFRVYDGWITKHDGVRGDIEYINIDGQQFAKDEGCEPHDCLDNSIVILANTQTKEIWMVHRIISFPNRKISIKYFGDPSETIRQKLVSYLVKP